MQLPEENMPTVDTRPLFLLHKAWNDAVLATNAAAQAVAFGQLAALGHNPQNMGLNINQRRTNLLNWERVRLRFQHQLRSLGMHTLIGPKIPGTVSETSAAYLLDTKGRGRVGQSAGANGLGGSDLVNGIEVKEAARCFVNIDLPFSGRIVRRSTHVWIQIDQNATDARTLEQLNGSLAGVMHQIASNALAVQKLDQNRRCDRDALWKTTSSHAIIRVNTTGTGAQGIQIWDRNAGVGGEWLPIDAAYSRRTFGADPLPADGFYIRLMRGTWRNVPQALDGQYHEFRLTQERPHFNIGDRTGQQFAEMINQGLALVSRHIDVDGRAAVAFLKLQTTNLATAQALMRRPGRPLAGDPYQFQPYLYHDNTRDCLYDNPNNGLMNLGALLLAYYLEDENDLQEVYWNPAGQPLSNADIQSLLTTSQTGRAINFPAFGATLGAAKPITDYDLTVDIGAGPVLFDHQNQAHCHQMMDDFAALLCEHYRDSRNHTDWTNTARKIFSGKECETFTALYTGLRGDRSMARGTDIYESNGQPSECKQVTGRRGDKMFTIHPHPPLHLRNPLGILSWNRLFVTSMEDRVAPLGLHMKLLVMCADPVLYDDARAYRRRRPGSPDLEYDSQNYASGAFGVANARPYLPSGGQIVPNRAFEFREGYGRLNFNPAFIPPCP